MQKIRVILFVAGILLISCARLPVQSIMLLDSITEEGKRMHEINLALTNKLFREKSTGIDDFIRNEYTPEFIIEFTANIPAGTDLQQALPDILNSIIPRINQRRDEMQSALESNRIKVVDKLNQDYIAWEIACIELKRLLESAVNVDKQRNELLIKTRDLSGNRIDFGKLENELDRFITDSGNWAENLNQLNESINRIINP